VKNIIVAANTPFNGSLLTYKVESELKKGTHVLAPLGKRVVNGWVIGPDDSQPDPAKLKMIETGGDATLNISHHEIELLQWMANYYHYPLGQLINDTLPKSMKRPRETEVEEFAQRELEPLTPLQEDIYQALGHKFKSGFSRQLIHGVTGSGKTHIYLHLMKDQLKKNKSVLFLLPEINLTPQFYRKFQEVLGCPVKVYSSETSASDKYLLRQNLKLQNTAQVILGVRSSVFLPIENLGLIIVDEEHDSSFKQDDRCTYNARDIAIKRASMLNIPVVLGSATPSMESYTAAKKTNDYHAIKERVHGFEMPKIEIIDQRSKSEDKASSSEHWPLTRATIESIYQAKQRGEQALVFINRLGFSSYIQCSSCGHQFQCLNCSTNMRYFKSRSELACQTCGNKTPMPKMCPECSCLTLSQKGYGTEKIVEVLSKIIPDLVVERFDRDEIKNIDQLKQSLERFARQEVDVLVGTQMLSKGHNFEKVNTVVVLGIDQQLNFPDFRAMERAWQTLVQVSGRSGRFGSESHVLVQTHSPEHPLFTHVVNHHFDEFYQEEMDLRERANCPPISKMAAIYLTHKDKNELIKQSMHFSDWAQGLKEHHFQSVDVLGPRPALMEKRVNKFTWCLMLRSHQVNDMHSFISAAQVYLSRVRGLHVKTDIDPQVIL
tara:strand:- start:5710 stop:7692 length:1983 start_codon:yes stop_codon:yes gene_type:complete